MGLGNDTAMNRSLYDPGGGQAGHHNPMGTDEGQNPFGLFGGGGGHPRGPGRYDWEHRGDLAAAYRAAGARAGGGFADDFANAKIPLDVALSLFARARRGKLDFSGDRAFGLAKYSRDWRGLVDELASYQNMFDPVRDARSALHEARMGRRDDREAFLTALQNFQATRRGVNQQQREAFRRAWR